LGVPIDGAIFKYRYDATSAQLVAAVK